MKHARPRPIRPDWVSKTLAGLVLGLTLALAASGILSVLTADVPLAVRGQLAMWIVPPIWLFTLGLVYFFESGLRAWLWLGGFNIVACGAWWALRAAAI